jgi:uncharacterized protein (TIGR02145 family)
MPADFGFTSLPGGYGNADGTFGYLGSSGYWWVTSEVEYNKDNAYTRYIGYSSEQAIWFTIVGKMDLASVRCLRE